MNVVSSSLHKEACNIWLVDPAVFRLQKAFKNFVLLKGSGNKCPFCLRWFSSDVMRWTCGAWGEVVTSHLRFCLPHFALIDAYTQTPFYEMFRCRLLQCSQIWQRCFFLLKAAVRVGDWDALFLFTLRFVATIETFWMNEVPAGGTWWTIVCAGFHLPRRNIPAVVFCTTLLRWLFLA